MISIKKHLNRNNIGSTNLSSLIFSTVAIYPENIILCKIEHILYRLIIVNIVVPLFSNIKFILTAK